MTSSGISLMSSIHCLDRYAIIPGSSWVCRLESFVVISALDIGFLLLLRVSARVEKLFCNQKSLTMELLVTVNSKFSNKGCAPVSSGVIFSQSIFGRTLRFQKLVRAFRKNVASFGIHSMRAFFRVGERLRKMSEQLKLPSRSHIRIKFFQSASRGWISLKIHIAGKALAWIFQSSSPAPPFFRGRGLAFC